jgi:DNA primase
MERLDYPDAIEFLAKRAGITIVDDNRGQYSNQPRIDRQRMYKMNVDAAKYFNASLFSDNPDAKAALSYFTESRKLSVATIKHFGLGYAPNSFDAFSKYMLAKGYTYDELVAGFLCGKSDRGTYYDTFRNRVMFPIIDVSGNVIAFGGRVMDDSKPKYKNSSDTPVFKKLRNLFALNFARHECEESLILCEGYMDVIALHSVGITNAVATLGTAITSEQARVMSRYTKRVIISYDSDEAGTKAALRAMKLLEEVGLEVSVLSVPGAKDPDEYIKKFGVDKFKQVINGAKSKFDYSLDSILSKYDITLPQDKINALGEVEKLISGVNSMAERDVYISTVAKKFDVQAASIRNDVDRIIAGRAKAYKRDEAQKIRQETAGYSDRINPDFLKSPAVARNEETVLGLMLLFPNHRKKVFEENLLSADNFITDLNKRIFSYIERAYNEGDENLITINEEFTLEEIGRISRMKIRRMELSSNDDDVLYECIDNLKKSVDKKESEKTDTIDKLNELLSKMRDN